MAKASTSHLSSSKSTTAKQKPPVASTSKQPAKRREKGEANKGGAGKTAKLRPVVSAGGGKGKGRALDVVEKSEKAKGKRKRVEEADESREEGDNKKKRAGPVLVRSVKRVVPNSVVSKSWRKLSRAGQVELQRTLEESALEILSQLEGKARNDMQVLLRELYEEIEDRLSELVVPPADASSRAAGSSSKGEVDILGADIITDKITAYEAALVPELAEVRALEREIKREQKLLVEDEARLLGFENARLKVESAEAKESSKNMHPLLRELLDSRAAPPPDFDLFERTRPSSTWIAESAIARLPQEKPAKLGQDEEEEDEEGSDAEYDPAKDDYLVSLARRVGGSLAEIEKRLEGLDRVERVVDQGERAVVGMM